VPDLAVFRPETERTSPAFLTTAELVVEILSPGERPRREAAVLCGPNIDEYLAIDLGGGSARLSSNRACVWVPVAESHVIDLTLDEVVALLARD
jgi:hypothetical protein